MILAPEPRAEGIFWPGKIVSVLWFTQPLRLARYFAGALAVRPITVSVPLADPRVDLKLTAAMCAPAM
jgi:hypothetical protein